MTLEELHEAQQRLLLKLDRTPRTRLFGRCLEATGGCWEFQGCITGNGYGQLSFNGKLFKASRLAFEIAVGPIGSGLCVCHTCDNRRCCNPGHLFLGTIGDNTRDCVAKGRHAKTKKTHCPKGHEYEGSNLYVSPRGDRICRTCMQAKGRERTARNRKSSALANLGDVEGR